MSEGFGKKGRPMRDLLFDGQFGSLDGKEVLENRVAVINLHLRMMSPMKLSQDELIIVGKLVAVTQYG